MSNTTQWIRKNIAEMQSYSSARNDFDGGEVVFLDANENPNDTGVNRYPDPNQWELKKRLAELKHVSVQQLLLGNGSDEVLDLLFRAFCEPQIDNVIFTSPSYGMYKVLANLNHVPFKAVGLQQDFSLEPDDVLAQVDDHTKMILLCTPNNPTGNAIPVEVIKQILNHTSCLVVIDEAYIDFSTAESLVSELDNYKHLVIIQTLSKYYGMAGLRLGMCMASEAIIKVLNKIKPPYNVNVLTQSKALELLEHADESYKIQVIQERGKLMDVLEALDYITSVYPSEANFILVKTINADLIYKKLIDKGIVVRNRTKDYMCENCLRISIGTPEQNSILINILKQLEL